MGILTFLTVIGIPIALLYILIYKSKDSYKVHYKGVNLVFNTSLKEVIEK